MRRSVLCLCSIALVAGCLWRGYADILRVHLEVLSGLAEKAQSHAAAGRRPTTNDVTELTYPLQRARQFAEQYRDDDARPSYALFVSALDRYQAFVDAIDAARGDAERWQSARQDLEARYAEWRAAAARVEAALAAER